MLAVHIKVGMVKNPKKNGIFRTEAAYSRTSLVRTAFFAAHPRENRRDLFYQSTNLESPTKRQNLISVFVLTNVSNASFKTKSRFSHKRRDGKN